MLNTFELLTKCRRPKSHTFVEMVENIERVELTPYTVVVRDVSSMIFPLFTASHRLLIEQRKGRSLR